MALPDWLKEFELQAIIATDDEMRIAAMLGRAVGTGVDWFDDKEEPWTMYDHAGRLWIVPDRLRPPPNARNSHHE